MINENLIGLDEAKKYLKSLENIEEKIFRIYNIIEKIEKIEDNLEKNIQARLDVYVFELGNCAFELNTEILLDILKKQYHLYREEYLKALEQSLNKGLMIKEADVIKKMDQYFEKSSNIGEDKLK